MSKNKDLDPFWVDYVGRWERVEGIDGKVMYRFKGCTEPVRALDDPTLPTPLPNWDNGSTGLIEASNGLGGSNLADVEYEEINRPILLMCRADRHVSHW